MYKKMCKCLFAESPATNSYGRDKFHSVAPDYSTIEKNSCDRHSQRDRCARVCLCVYAHETHALFMQYLALIAILA